MHSWINEFIHNAQGNISYPIYTLALQMQN